MNTFKAVFFDRDGTIIEDVGYLSNLNDITFIEPMISFMQFCQQAGYLIIIVTNQSGIARGYFDELFVTTTNATISNMLQQHNITVHASYYCPHHPTKALHEQYRQQCLCRKPSPGMLLQAAHDWKISLEESFMVGDKDSDLQAGIAAGCTAIDVSKILNISPKKFSSLLKTK